MPHRISVRAVLPLVASLILSMDQSKSLESQIWFDDVRLEMLSPDGLEKNE